MSNIASGLTSAAVAKAFKTECVESAAALSSFAPPTNPTTVRPIRKNGNKNLPFL